MQTQLRVQLKHISVRRFRIHFAQGRERLEIYRSFCMGIINNRRSVRVVACGAMPTKKVGGITKEDDVKEMSAEEPKYPW